MTREIFLLVYPSPLFAAHWSLWIPSQSNPELGKVVHVTGAVSVGFILEFKRNYDIANTGRGSTLILLAEVDDKYVADVPGDGAFSLDQNAVDDIERLALTFPPPTKSLTQASDGVWCFFLRFFE